MKVPGRILRIKKVEIDKDSYFNDIYIYHTIEGNIRSKDKITDKKLVLIRPKKESSAVLWSVRSENDLKKKIYEEDAKILKESIKFTLEKWNVKVKNYFDTKLTQLSEVINSKFSIYISYPSFFLIKLEDQFLAFSSDKYMCNYLSNLDSSWQFYIFPYDRIYVSKDDYEIKVPLNGIYFNFCRPKVYKAWLEINNFSEKEIKGKVYSRRPSSHKSNYKEVTLILHGFAVIDKWHINILKHATNENLIEENKKEELNQIINKLPDGCKKKKCIEDKKCIIKSEKGKHPKEKEEKFKKAQKLLEPYLEEYQKKAFEFFEVTFGSEGKTIFIEGYHVFEKKGKQPRKVWLVEGKLKKDKLLICRGVSWNFEEKNPCLHLSFLTFYEATQKQHKFYQPFAELGKLLGQGEDDD